MKLLKTFLAPNLCPSRGLNLWPCRCWLQETTTELLYTTLFSDQLKCCLDSKSRSKFTFPLRDSIFFLRSHVFDHIWHRHHWTLITGLPVSSYCSQNEPCAKMQLSGALPTEPFCQGYPKFIFWRALPPFALLLSRDSWLIVPLHERVFSSQVSQIDYFLSQSYHSRLIQWWFSETFSWWVSESWTSMFTQAGSSPNKPVWLSP